MPSIQHDAVRLPRLVQGAPDGVPGRAAARLE